MQTLGEIGYEKWRSLLPPSAKAGLPAWDRLPEGSRLGWEDVAIAIVDKHRDNELVRKIDDPDSYIDAG